MIAVARLWFDKLTMSGKLLKYSRKVAHGSTGSPRAENISSYKPELSYLFYLFSGMTTTLSQKCSMDWTTSRNRSKLTGFVM